MLGKKQLWKMMSVVLLAGCGSDGADFVKTASKDGKIDAAEFQKIASTLRASRRGAAQYKTEAALCDFILKNARPGTICDLCVVSAGASSTVVLEKAVFDAYLENSLSMDGYVQGNTEFKNVVYSFLTDISLKTNGLTDSLHLYYVNSEILPFQQDIRDFIEQLNPLSFKQRGGTRSTSDIGLILEKILRQTDANRVAIMFSDCVFSPGKGKNAKDYLTAQSIGIKRAFADALTRQTDMATVVIQLKSAFNGNYYDFENHPTPLKAQRPYYIWWMGSEKNIKKIFKSIDIQQSKRGGITGLYAMYPAHSPLQIPFKVLRSDKMGSFDFDRNSPQNTLIGAKMSDRSAQFQFAIGVNLSELGLSEDYLTDAKNYRLNTADYTLRIQKLGAEEQRNDPALADFSHKLILNTQQLKNQSLVIELLQTVPAWVAQSNSEDDRVQKDAELNKTFGIQYLIEGVSDAYSATSKGEKVFFTVKIVIKK